uniref:hypothetical protein n=1 Tax=Frigoriglobus tundricola TaxID=2774151 RepID=UPI0036F28F8E
MTHAYDPVGNRTAQTDSGTRTTYAYDNANQLGREQTNTARTTYAYDPAGNRVQKADPAATTYYVWDAKSRLAVAEPVAGRVTYAYDGIGRRATKQSGSGAVRFVWDFKKVLQEADGGTGATEYQFLTTEGEYGDLVSGYGNAPPSTTGPTHSARPTCSSTAPGRSRPRSSTGRSGSRASQAGATVRAWPCRPRCPRSWAGA